MKDIVHPKGKVYYTMGEVAEMLDVNPSLLRYWEQEFDVIKPHRNKKGNRLFKPQDVDNIKIIHHLLKEKKMKIEVARKHLKNHKSEINRDADIMERLLSIRATLMQIKQEMLDSNAETGRPGIIIHANNDFAEESPVGNSVAEAFNDGIGTDIVEKGGVVSANDMGALEDGGFSKLSDIVPEGRDEENLPFREQMLFEIYREEAGYVNLDNMIDSFLSKNWDPENGQEQIEYDPFAPDNFSGSGLEQTDDAAGASSVDCKPKLAAIEQTLF